MPDVAPWSWLDEPLARPLLEFNFLPACLCHPDRLPPGWAALEQQIAGLSGDPAASGRELRRAYRLASAVLLPGLHDQWVVSLDDPALPLFMAPAKTFHRLVLHLGLVPLGPSVRRVIARDEVRALEEKLGLEALDFARREAARWWPGTADTAPVLEAEPHAQARLLGAAVLCSVACQATAPVAIRAQLRLPELAQDATARLPAPFRDGPLPLALALSTLHKLDPQWTSLFPARS